MVSLEFHKPLDLVVVDQQRNEIDDPQNPTKENCNHPEYEFATQKPVYARQNPPEEKAKKQVDD